MHGKNKFLKEIIEFLLVYRPSIHSWKMFGIMPVLLWGSGRPKTKDRKQEGTTGLKEKSEKATEIFRGDFSFSNF